MNPERTHFNRKTVFGHYPYSPPVIKAFTVNILGGSFAFAWSYGNPFLKY